MDSPGRLGVSPAAATPIGFYSQRFWGFISPCWNPVFGLSCSPVVLRAQMWDCQPPLRPCCRPATAFLRVLSTCLSPPLLPIWMNVSLTSWLSNFHTLWFSGSSGCFITFKLLVMLLLVVQGNEAYLLRPPSWPLLRNKYCVVLIMKLMHAPGGIYRSTMKKMNLFKTGKNHKITFLKQKRTKLVSWYTYNVIIFSHTRVSRFWCRISTPWLLQYTWYCSIWMHILYLAVVYCWPLACDQVRALIISSLTIFLQRILCV